MKTKRKVSLPLRTFSWSFKEEESKTKEELFVESTVLEWYEAKHRILSNQELAFINNVEIETCPFCGSKRFSKNGHTQDGLQRFKCRSCKRRFNILTGTIFDSKKIPISEWIEYLLHLFEFHSIRSSAFDNRNAESTGRYWMKKVFLVLRNIQDDILLKGTIYIDECFFSVINKDIKKKNGKKLRGISQNQICVVTGVDSYSSFFIATEVSKLSERASLNYYGKHIKKGSKIIHDLERSHNILIEKLSLRSEAYDSTIIKKLPDDKNPLQPINKLHDLLKKFMSSHGGYNRNELQDWLNLFWFIRNGPKDRYDKVLLFIQKAIKLRKKLRYRTFGSKKVRLNRKKTSPVCK